MRFNKGDWVLIGKGKVAHKLGQGYNALIIICTPESHSCMGTDCADIEQEDMKPQGNARKCKRCLAIEAKWNSRS